MEKNKHNAGKRHGLQNVTLCISTALVLILLGIVVFTMLAGRNLSQYVRENLVITLMLDQDVNSSEAAQMQRSLTAKPYVKNIHFISKEQSLQEARQTLGTDPTDFTDGQNPFMPSMELTLKSDYANSDSLKWISKEFERYPMVTSVTYQKDLVDQVNQNLAKISVVLLILAVMLTLVSFSLINNTVRLGIYARRFSIHTMKLVGASWGFIRRPFVWRAVLIGLIAAVLACCALGGCMYGLYINDSGILDVISWQDMAITAVAVFGFGIIITALCAAISVNKFLRMTAGDLYKI